VTRSTSSPRGQQTARVATTTPVKNCGRAREVPVTFSLLGFEQHRDSIRSVTVSWRWYLTARQGTAYPVRSSGMHKGLVIARG
jgi:hypothetical protein